MKRLAPLLLALFLLLLGRLAARAQSVGIGTATPDAKAALDISAIDKGLLVPRLTAGQRSGPPVGRPCRVFSHSPFFPFPALP